MGACKGCGDIVSALEIKDGLCNRCTTGDVKPKEVTAEEVEEMAKAEEKEIEETKAYFFAVIALLIILYIFFGGEDKPKEAVEPTTNYVENPTKIKIRSVGCKDPNEVGEATRDLMNGGLAAFLTHKGCIIVIKGEPIKVLDRGMFHTKVLYTLEGQSPRVLWIGSDVME